MNPADLFREETDTVQLAPGDFLFREGDKRDSMYVLLEGEVDIRLGDYVVETAKEGALIGEMALIDDSPRAANALAKSACRLAQIDRQVFDFVIQQHPPFARHVMKVLADRLRHMNVAAMRWKKSYRSVSRSAQRARRRVAAWLALCRTLKQWQRRPLKRRGGTVHRLAYTTVTLSPESNFDIGHDSCPKIRLPLCRVFGQTFLYGGRNRLQVAI
jgi:CRP-like cAMP-binding protein